MNDTQPRIALVTGGSRGLGRSMAEKLGARGVDVVLTYRTGEAAAQEGVASLERLGRRAAALRLDLADRASFATFAGAVERTIAAWGAKRIDFVVHNAGDGGFAPFAEITEAHLDAILDVHLKAPVFLTQALLPLIADGGRIVHVTTGLTRYSFPGASAYAAAKGALEVFTRYMAVELGGRRITVNAVAPGGIETDFGGGTMRDPGLQKVVAAETASGRIGVPDDIGGVVAMLLSEGGRWINGQRIEVTGGYRL